MTERIETPAAERAGLASGRTGGDESAQPAGQKGGKTPARPGKGRTAALVIAGVVLLGGGIGIGSALTDPTASEEYASLAAANDAMESSREDLQIDYDALKADYDVMASGIDERETQAEEREAALEKGEAELKEAEAAVAEREKKVSGAEKEKAENTIREGTWTVGVDIAAGTYRTTDSVGSTCYWGIYTSGTNGDDIIANDIPGGGRPTVTLSKGQDFNTTRCGTWEKQ
ncbi:hypothetical protein D477_002441 [Arthrobacter crystallopoietes BAB-32]|uniref:Uncharacterized protein n=1 Tax=Arthrobacter crystallopoietes BAB-32 TaxID=1246476 RepID=N1V6V0_9MICC|nr:hypothetical protein [Arthrobacter crystallopoietes]EMY35812.1 hypothetical protein D477_002441 [Arthrobacter crystallopoietes BAB-32]